MTKADLLKYIDERLTRRSDGNIGMLMVRQYVQDNMEDMPSVKPERSWIPVSERLPEDGRLVLTTIIGTDIIHQREGETLVDAIERVRKMKRVSVGFLGSDGWYGADGYPEIVMPRAWMPLPEPWKGEE